MPSPFKFPPGSCCCGDEDITGYMDLIVPYRFPPDAINNHRRFTRYSIITTARFPTVGYEGQYKDTWGIEHHDRSRRKSTGCAIDGDLCLRGGQITTGPFTDGAPYPSTVPVYLGAAPGYYANQDFFQTGWAVLEGVWAKSLHSLYMVTGQGESAITPVRGVITTDYFTPDVQLNSYYWNANNVLDNWGVLFRFSSWDNTWRFYWNGLTREVVIAKIVQGGVATSSSAVLPNDFNLLRFEVLANTNSITAYAMRYANGPSGPIIVGTTTFNETDNYNSLTTPTQYGLFGYHHAPNSVSVGTASGTAFSVVPISTERLTVYSIGERTIKCDIPSIEGTPVAPNAVFGAPGGSPAAFTTNFGGGPYVLGVTDVEAAKLAYGINYVKVHILRLDGGVDHYTDFHANDWIARKLANTNNQYLLTTRRHTGEDWTIIRTCASQAATVRPKGWPTAIGTRFDLNGFTVTGQVNGVNVSFRPNLTWYVSLGTMSFAAPQDVNPFPTFTPTTQLLSFTVQGPEFTVNPNLTQPEKDDIFFRYSLQQPNTGGFPVTYLSCLRDGTAITQNLVIQAPTGLIAQGNVLKYNSALQSGALAPGHAAGIFLDTTPGSTRFFKIHPTYEDRHPTRWAFASVIWGGAKFFCVAGVSNLSGYLTNVPPGYVYPASGDILISHDGSVRIPLTQYRNGTYSNDGRITANNPIKITADQSVTDMIQTSIPGLTGTSPDWSAP